jgi:hypothetical protein
MEKSRPYTPPSTVGFLIPLIIIAVPIITFCIQQVFYPSLPRGEPMEAVGISALLAAVCLWHIGLIVAVGVATAWAVLGVILTFACGLKHINITIGYISFLVVYVPILVRVLLYLRSESKFPYSQSDDMVSLRALWKWSIVYSTTWCATVFILLSGIRTDWSSSQGFLSIFIPLPILAAGWGIYYLTTSIVALVKERIVDKFDLFQKLFMLVLSATPLLLPASVVILHYVFMFSWEESILLPIFAPLMAYMVIGAAIMAIVGILWLIITPLALLMDRD